MKLFPSIIQVVVHNAPVSDVRSTEVCLKIHSVSNVYK